MLWVALGVFLLGVLLLPQGRRACSAVFLATIYVCGMLAVTLYINLLSLYKGTRDIDV